MDIVKDIVNHPDHYTVGGIETLAVIKAKLTREEYIGYLKGNCIKYLLRANHKGSHDTDVRKSAFYARELGDMVEQPDPNQGSFFHGVTP